MDDAAKAKARETRIKNQEARTAMYAARLALQRVFESPDADPEQILRAAELLEKISKIY